MSFAVGDMVVMPVSAVLPGGSGMTPPAMITALRTDAFWANVRWEAGTWTAVNGAAIPTPIGLGVPVSVLSPA